MARFAPLSSSADGPSARINAVSAKSAASPRMPVGPYWYENLGEDEFQKLRQVIVAGKYDRVTCYPVGQKDGGRDITRRSGSWILGAVATPR
jgi:hypothetical protein